MHKINRRNFFSKTAKTVAATSIGIASLKDTVLAVEPTGNFNMPGFIIDSHVHCGSTEKWVIEMVNVYRANNAMGCVFTWMHDLDLMTDAIKEFPEIFIGYGRVNLDDQNAVTEVEKFKKNDFVGMKFHSPQKNYDDPSYFQVYRLCEEYGMHMIFHTGISSHTIKDIPQWGSSARMRPIYLDTICRQFPGTTVQGAHLGNPWYDEAAEAARWNPKLYFDISGSTLIKLQKLNRLNTIKDFFWWAENESENNPHTFKGGPGAWEHIIFGSDEEPSGLEPNIRRFQMMLHANNVSEKFRPKMWGLTIARILGINPKIKAFKKK